MIQWKARFVVLAGALALIASALGGSGHITPLHFGW